jgi:cobalt-zinc-cadmium efflux system outer membrane protein
MGWMLVIAILQVGADTVTVSAAEALTRAVEASPAVEAAALEAQSAAFGAQQAEAWGNPLLSVSVENLGSSEEFTGVPGVRGLEGQALLSTSVGLGGDRGSRIRYAQALERQASAGATVVRADHAQAAAEIIAAALRDRALVETAREELETMDRLAAALALQEEEGRASRGDAARADLARGQAATRLARRRVAEAGSSETLARILGLEPGTAVNVTLGACVRPDSPEAPPDGPEAPADSLTPGMASPVPDLLAADARLEAAQAGIDQALARRVPDLIPQVGLRRTGGNSGLYLGINAALPLFDYGNRGVDAARASEAAADRGREDLVRRLAAERSAAARSRQALEAAGQAFSAAWRANLEAAVTAAEARFELGEGTLYELLDNRRARLAALEDYWQWQAEWWAARAREARLEGAGLSAFAPCAFPETEGEG